MSCDGSMVDTELHSKVGKRTAGPVPGHQLVDLGSGQSALYGPADEKLKPEAEA